jgi:hypothetical protein
MIEKAPLMSAWLATIDERVATMSIWRKRRRMDQNDDKQSKLYNGDIIAL